MFFIIQSHFNQTQAITNEFLKRKCMLKMYLIYVTDPIQLMPRQVNRFFPLILNPIINYMQTDFTEFLKKNKSLLKEYVEVRLELFRLQGVKALSNLSACSSG